MARLLKTPISFIILTHSIVVYLERMPAALKKITEKMKNNSYSKRIFKLLSFENVSKVDCISTVFIFSVFINIKLYNVFGSISPSHENYVSILNTLFQKEFYTSLPYMFQLSISKDGMCLYVIADLSCKVYTALMACFFFLEFLELKFAATLIYGVVLGLHFFDLSSFNYIGGVSDLTLLYKISIIINIKLCISAYIYYYRDEWE